MPNSSRYGEDLSDEANYEPDDVSDSPDPHADTGRRKMAFEALETVVGVIVYDFGAFKDAGHDLHDVLDDDTSSDAAAARDWILEHGTPVVINRQTGTVMNKP
jgi:hypothetical protein